MSNGPSSFIDSASVAAILSAAADAGTLDTPGGVWETLLAGGMPLTDDESGERTFVWRPPSRVEVPPDAVVHLHINRITDKDNHDRGLMEAVSGTNIWVLTLRLPETLRASYGFTIRTSDETPGHRKPKHNHYDTFRDPHSRVHPLVADGDEGGLSVFTGRLAPTLPEWESGVSSLTDDEVRGSVVTGSLELALSPGDRARVPARECHLYLPAQEDVAGPVPLLTVFDAESWFSRMHLPAALERARSFRRLPPIAVLGLTAEDVADRKASLGANPAFLRDVATTATEWARKQATARGLELGPRDSQIVAGQSLGGLSALCAARDLGEFYGHAISQSPSMWWTPDGLSTPRDLESCITPWITETFPMAPDTSAPQPMIHLDVGLRETVTVPHIHALGMRLDAAKWPHTVNLYDGGHDHAWWRVSLLDRLAEILVPPR